MKEGSDGQPKRFILCARVSTEEQGKKGVSITHQIDSAREKVAELGGVVVGTCIEAGVSGSLYDSRADLQRALGQVEGGQAQGLVWYDLSRMSRDIEYIHVIQRRVTAAGGEVHFVTAEYADDADGFLHRGISGVVHQHARLKTREISMANRRKAVLSGRQTQRSVAPFGYKVVNRDDVIRGTHTTDQLGHYEIVPDQAAVVKKIFERYQAGDSLRAICKYLQGEGIATPKGRRAGQTTTGEGEVLVGTAGREWLASTVKAILANPCHYGRASFGKTRTVADEGRLKEGFKRPFRRETVPESQWLYIECPPIVSRELWDACQVRMKEAKTLFAGSPERKYMLTGLLRCPKCHRTMAAARRSKPYAHEQEKRVVYHCKWSSPSRSIQRVQCEPKQYWGDDLERQVLEAVRIITTQPEQLEQAFRSHQAALQREHSPDEHSRLKRELGDLEKRMLAAVEAQVEAKMLGVDQTIYEKILQDTSARRQSLRDRLARFEEQTAKANDCSKPARMKARLISQTAGNILFALEEDDVTPPTKQGILARLIESIYPNPDGSLRIAFRIGAFEPHQRWVLNAGIWHIEDTQS